MNNDFTPDVEVVETVDGFLDRKEFSLKYRCVRRKTVASRKDFSIALPDADSATDFFTNSGSVREYLRSGVAFRRYNRYFSIDFPVVLENEFRA